MFKWKVYLYFQIAIFGEIATIGDFLQKNYGHMLISLMFTIYFFGGAFKHYSDSLKQ